MTINELIENEKWPIVNSVIFPDGRMVILSMQTLENIEGDLVDKSIRPICESNMESFYKFNSDWITGTSILNRYESVDGVHKLVCGEAGMGADGFIFLLKNDQLVWYLFLDRSNPFVNVEIEANKVIARNNLHEKWIIDMDTPWIIDIDLGNKNTLPTDGTFFNS